MLQTYSKYCRLFLTDSEMLEEYQAAVEKHATITQADINWWNYFKSFFVKVEYAKHSFLRNKNGNCKNLEKVFQPLKKTVISILTFRLFTFLSER